jgi:endoglucanase
MFMKPFLNPESEKFLNQLVSACGISGNVQEVSQVVRKRLDVPPIQILDDEKNLGVVQAVIHPEKKFRVMLESHMDVVGLRINYMDDQGFCYLRPVGGIDLLSLKGHKIRIHTKKGVVKALIQGLPIHHSTPEARKKAPKLEELYVRSEFTGKPLEMSPIRVGDAVTFASGLEDLGPDLMIAPGLDNRLGVFLMVELMRRLEPKDLNICLYGIANSGEEIGCRGIRAVTQSLAPDLAIAIDVTNATDYPGVNKKKLGHQVLGGGAVIARGYNTRTPYTDQLMAVAEECAIPFQIRAEDITATDGREIDEAGAPTLVVRVPASMLHTAHDCVDRADIETTAQLLFEFLKRLP